MMKAKSLLKRARRGSEFRGFLKKQGILKEVEARTLKQAVKLTHQTGSPCSDGWSTGLS
jgi:elongation factor P--beta-lysine ligase